MGIVLSIVAAATSYFDLKAHQIADLVQLDFYFCLRSCKYTKCTCHRRTVKLHPLLDFVFFVGTILLPLDAPIEHFRQATQVFLTLENQKNAI